jgi:hypothetical protein
MFAVFGAEHPIFFFHVPSDALYNFQRLDLTYLKPLDVTTHTAALDLT